MNNIIGIYCIKNKENKIHPVAVMETSAFEFLRSTIGAGKLIVEVGCYRGGTTCMLAEHNRVIAIDPFISDYDPADTMKNLDGVADAFKEAIEGMDVLWLKAKSEDVLKFWQSEIDGVFIDGNHSEPFVLIDIGWIKFVKPGGIIAFHDYNAWRGVHAVVDQCVKGKYEQVGIIGDLIIFRK